MTLRIPNLNPFPAQATTSVDEGSFLDSYRVWAETTPTLTVEPVRRLLHLARRFRGTFDARAPIDGEAAFVHGAHGTGKTHAIRAAIGAVATELPDRSLLPIYVKLGSPDFQPAYRRLMSQLSMSEMTDLALRFLGWLSQTGPRPLGPATTVLQEQPTALLDMFDEHLVERGLLLEAQADRVQDVVRDETNFQRALTYLLEPDLKEAAFGWLRGQDIPKADLQRLGISGRLEGPDQCRYGLQLLCLICSRVGRPLVLILDQAEKFFMDSGGALIPENTGLIHSLAESVPDLGGMLVVAANDDVWCLLPQDLRQRFGLNDIACGPLQPAQAIELLGLYVTSVLPTEPTGSYRAPWPFTEAAVQKLLRNSGGNPRALLQLSWQAFDEVDRNAEVIDTAAIPDEVVVYDRSAVDMAVRRALWRLGPLTVNPPEEGFHYALTLPGVRLLFRLSEALFYLREAERAEEDVLARLASGAASTSMEGVADRHVLVVIGYASTAVLDLLRQVYDEVIVYRDARSMSSALRELVGTSDSGGNEPPAAPDVAGIYGQLAELGWARSQHSDRLRGGVAGLSRVYSADAAVARIEELAQRWPAERGQLAQSIAENRRQRGLAELEEFHRAASEYQAARLFRIVVAGAVVLGLLGGLTIWFDPPAALRNSFVGSLALALALIVTAGRRLRPARSAPPASIADVERIARKRIRSRSFAPLAWLTAAGSGNRAVPGPLRSGDPYRRYGYLLRDIDFYHRPLRWALEIEPVGLIRRRLAERLGQLRAPEVIFPMKNLAELPYALQFQPPMDGEDVARLQPRDRLLVALDRPGPPRSRRTERLVDEPGRLPDGIVVGQDARSRLTPGGHPAEETDPAFRYIIRTASGQGALGTAYRKGLAPERLLDALREVEEPELRRIERLLSPVDGLGSYDELLLAEEIESLYLFFAQLRYFRDGGVEPGE